MDTKTRVLVIEDNIAIENLIRHYIDPSLFEVFYTSSPKKGLEWAEKNKPEAAIIDYFLPEMDGLQAAEILTESVPECEKIIMSSQTQILEMLPDKTAFLKKPFTGRTILLKLERALKHSMAQPHA